MQLKPDFFLHTPVAGLVKLQKPAAHSPSNPQPGHAPGHEQACQRGHARALQELAFALRGPSPACPGTRAAWAWPPPRRRSAPTRGPCRTGSWSRWGSCTCAAAGSRSHSRLRRCAQAGAGLQGSDTATQQGMLHQRLKPYVCIIDSDKVSKGSILHGGCSPTGEGRRGRRHQLGGAGKHCALEG